MAIPEEGIGRVLTRGKGIIAGANTEYAEPRPVASTQLSMLYVRNVEVENANSDGYSRSKPSRGGMTQ